MASVNALVQDLHAIHGFLQAHCNSQLSDQLESLQQMQASSMQRKILQCSDLSIHNMTGATAVIQSIQRGPWKEEHKYRLVQAVHAKVSGDEIDELSSNTGGIVCNLLQ